MNLEKIELHDAVLLKLDVDYKSKIVKIDLDSYESCDSSVRRSVTLVFNGVESVSHVCDLESLERNAGAGNVSYWHPMPGSGATYVYLVDGLIAIRHKGISLM